jgi:hypothetical protein
MRIGEFCTLGRHLQKFLPEVPNETSNCKISGLSDTSACLLLAAVGTDYDHKADFGKYHTYSWIGVSAGNSLWQDRITQAVDSALSAKGWSKVQSGGDAAVSAMGKITERDTMETFYTDFRDGDGAPVGGEAAWELLKPK